MKEGWRVLLVAGVLLAFGLRAARDSLDEQQRRLAQPEESFTRNYPHACAGSDEPLPAPSPVRSAARHERSGAPDVCEGSAVGVEGSGEEGAVTALLNSDPSP